MEENIVGYNVKRICKNENLQLRELAEKMGCAPESLTRTLQGNPRLTTILKIAEALVVSPKTLFENPDEVEGYILINGQAHHFNSKHELLLLQLSNN